MSAEVQREQIKTWTCLEPRAAATVGECLGELGRDRNSRRRQLPETSSSSSAADSLERLRRWGSEESVNGYYLQRTYRHESATAARCALWGSARPYALYAGGSRQSCVLWQVNGLSSARGRESCS